MLRRSMGVDSIEGLRLVDLGCGFGALSAFFAGRGAIVTGIDPIQDRLDVGRTIAAEHGLQAEFVPGRMEDLDLPDRSFDIAVQNNSLCYIVGDVGHRFGSAGDETRARSGRTIDHQKPESLEPAGSVHRHPAHPAAARGTRDQARGVARAVPLARSAHVPTSGRSGAPAGGLRGRGPRRLAGQPVALVHEVTRPLPAPHCTESLMSPNDREKGRGACREQLQGAGGLGRPG